jgi:hypothetical protein
MRLKDRIERMAKAGDAVKEFVKEAAEVLDAIRDAGRLSGGIEVVSYNPLEFGWHIDIPKEEGG